MTIILSLAALIIAGVAVALGIRVGTLKADVTRERQDKKRYFGELNTATKNLTTTRERHKKVVSTLNQVIDGLEKDLESCAEPNVWRNRLNRLRGVTKGVEL